MRASSTTFLDERLLCALHKRRMRLLPMRNDLPWPLLDLFASLGTGLLRLTPEASADVQLPTV